MFFTLFKISFLLFKFIKPIKECKSLGLRFNPGLLANSNFAFSGSALTPLFLIDISF